MGGRSGDDPDADRGDARRRDLRDSISAAALGLVLERGLDAVTVDDIARAANVSRRTFFNYFPSKAAACIPLTFSEDRDAIGLFLVDRSVPTLTALARLLWCQVSVARRETPDFQRFHDLWRREPGIRQELYAVLARAEEGLAVLVARREGREPGSVEATTVAAASIAIVRVAVEQWRSDESPLLLEDRITQAFDAVTTAATTAPAAG